MISFSEGPAPTPDVKDGEHPHPCEFCSDRTRTTLGLVGDRAGVEQRRYACGPCLMRIARALALQDVVDSALSAALDALYNETDPPAAGAS